MAILKSNSCILALIPLPLINCESWSTKSPKFIKSYMPT